jgi:phage internal scaffolding protein
MNKFQTAYKVESKPVVKTGEGLTEQAHADECDMNKILNKYAKTGFIEHAKKNEGRYDDVSAIDFQKAMDTVAQVKTMFEELPSKFRAEFGSPEGFLTFAQDPANAQTMQKMGILHGNDGFDISGAQVMTPTEALAALQSEQQALKDAQASQEAPQQVTEPQA